jgi:hypothetical protein
MVPRDALVTLAIVMVRRRLRGRAGAANRNALLGNAGVADVRGSMAKSALEDFSIRAEAVMEAR